MTIPLIVLAVLATVGGLVGMPHVFHVPHYFNEFLSPVIFKLSTPEAHHAHLDVSTEWMLMGIAVAGAVLSIILAWSMFVSKSKVPVEDAAEQGLGKFIYNKMYIDELYHAIIVSPAQKISEVLYKVVDRLLIDGIVNLSGKISMAGGQLIRTIQTGQTAFYILAMVLSIIFILGYFLTSF
jgi:NADH-quinone oxidoreductase subunit L